MPQAQQQIIVSAVEPQPKVIQTNDFQLPSKYKVKYVQTTQPVAINEGQKQALLNNPGPLQQPASNVLYQQVVQQPNVHTNATGYQTQYKMQAPSNFPPNVHETYQTTFKAPNEAELRSNYVLQQQPRVQSTIVPQSSGQQYYQSQYQTTSQQLTKMKNGIQPLVINRQENILDEQQPLTPEFSG